MTRCNQSVTVQFLCGPFAPWRDALDKRAFAQSARDKQEVTWTSSNIFLLLQMRPAHVAPFARWRDVGRRVHRPPVLQSTLASVHGGAPKDQSVSGTEGKLPVSVSAGLGGAVPRPAFLRLCSSCRCSCLCTPAAERSRDPSLLGAASLMRAALVAVMRSRLQATCGKKLEVAQTR